MGTTDRVARLSFPMLLALLVGAWATWMTVSGSWLLFEKWWPVSITMVIGSFVAGSTAAGGGAVSFPVFTKLLHIPADEARTFGLLIQSVGMTMASVDGSMGSHQEL